MAMRYLGPGFEIHTGGIDNVFPHHEDEIAQSTPITGGPPVQRLGPRGAPARGGSQDGQVDRQLRAGHRAPRPRHRPAGLPLSRADRALRAQAQLLGRVDRRRRGGTVVAAGSPRRARSPAGRRPVGGAGAAAGRLRRRTARGDRRRHGGAPGRRPGRGRLGLAAGRSCGGGRRSPLPRRASAPRAVRRGDRRRPRPADRARGGPRVAADGPAARRATLARPRRGPRPGARPRSRLGLDSATTCRPAPPRCWQRGARRARPGTGRAADALRDELAALGVELTDGPDGTTARRRDA